MLRASLDGKRAHHVQRHIGRRQHVQPGELSRRRGQGKAFLVLVHGGGGAGGVGHLPEQRESPLAGRCTAPRCHAGARSVCFVNKQCRSNIKEKKTERVASQVTTTGKAALGGPWVLVDQDGIPRTDASYKGKYQILYFGFSFCPDICPSELVKIGKVIDILTEKGIDVTPLFITVDPPRDTIQQLKNYSNLYFNKVKKNLRIDEL